MPVAYNINNHSSNSIPSDSSRLCLEAGRLESFHDGWPHPDNSLCSRERMAKAGFFYSGNSDQVKCFVCQLKLKDWDSETDEPWLKHQEFSRDCMFAQLGKEEGSLTVEQWCDVNNSRVVNMLDGKFNRLIEHNN